jgi:ArsR family transcriptional regulator, arsenate/arsenite/antimonite-responsive transcriptional repressor
MKLTLEGMADMLGALAHPARLAVLRSLLRAHPAGLVVGELQEAIDIPASTLSHHLDELRRHGLVEQTREGRFLRYCAAPDHLIAIVRYLVEECCTGSSGQPLVSIRRR